MALGAPTLARLAATVSKLVRSERRFTSAPRISEAPGKKSAPTTMVERDRGFADSSLEGDGFEPSVPLYILTVSGSALPCYSDRDHPGARMNEKSVQEDYHAHTGQFIIGAVFKKGTRRDPDSFLGLLSGPP
jgi:hypothetical protein